MEMDIRWFFFFFYDQLQKKVHQLQEQLDDEMQAKDELEHKFKYDRMDEHAKTESMSNVSTGSDSVNRQCLLR